MDKKELELARTLLTGYVETINNVQKAIVDYCIGLETELKETKEKLKYKDSWIYGNLKPEFGKYVLVRDGNSTKIATYDQYHSWKDKYENTLINVTRWTYFPRTKDEKEKEELDA